MAEQGNLHWPGRLRFPAVFPLAACLLAALVLSPQAHGAREPFANWLGGVTREAVASGISRTTVEAAFRGVEPLARIIELDRSQPDTRLTLRQYLDRVVTEQRVKQGRTLLRRYRPLLEKIGRDYGVQPRFIVALWGVETSYGARTGGFPVIQALATLAYDGRRSKFFRNELLAALRILDAGDIPLARMKGSWAGAMGQSQFMPSSYLRFAVDADGDQRRDIWETKADVFASIARYLQATGWRADRTWGRKARLPKRPLSSASFGLKHKKNLPGWAALGVRRNDRSALPRVNVPASLIQPDGKGAQAFLVYGNFHRILRWNRSTFFAVSVGLLSDRIANR